MSSIDLSKHTETVIRATGSKASPRSKQIFPVLIRKLHEFAVEVDLTVDEWLAACNALVSAGKFSDETRNEVVLISDILGLESLVDVLEHERHAKNAKVDATDSAILGPFYRHGVPIQEIGTSIVRTDEPNAEYVHLYGAVYDTTGRPLPKAVVDVWHDAPDGLYDSQTPEKPEYHCRGRFLTDAKGRYDLICLRPTPYPIPYDATAGELLKLLDRHPMRPAHIHFFVTADGHRPLITQVFDRKSDYLKDDSVFAVKDNLIVDFKPIQDSKLDWQPPKELQGKINYELEYNITLAPQDPGS